MSRTRAVRVADVMDDVFMLNGLCAETDPEAFFPEKGDNPGLAKLICSRCDVRTECLEWALRKDERYGVWGGTSENDRRKLRKIARAQS